MSDVSKVCGVDVGSVATVNGVSSIAAVNGATWSSGWTEADADANTFVVQMLGGASENETGAGGGLTGADLVFTQSGGVAGSVNNGRTLDGGDDYFSLTQNCAALFKSTTYGALFAVEDWGGSGQEHLMDFRGAGNLLGLIRGSEGTLRLYSDPSGVVYTATTNTIPTTGKLWIALWSDGSNSYGGFKAVSNFNSPPTGLSDFAVDDRVTRATYNFSATDFISNRKVGGYDGSSFGAALKLYTVVFSKTGFPTKS